MTLIVENLRAFAADAQAAADMVSEHLPAIVKVAMRQNARMFNAAADHIEAEERRFAEHLEARKANNAWHAARIAELEKQLAEVNFKLECHERDEM
jgi:hypothetical protein